MTFRRELLVVCLMLLSTMGALLWYGSSDNYMVCDHDCGEIPFAYRAALQYDKVGVRYALIENQGTPEHPFLYTHNVNLGAYFYTALHAMGLKDFRSNQVVLVFAMILGLFYVYLTVRLFSRSELLALIALTAFCTCYWGILSFAFNALRAWHLLALFMPLYHFSRLINAAGDPDGKPDRRILNVALLCIGAVTAFGIGYDYWIIAGLACGFVSLRWLYEKRDVRGWVRACAILAMAFAVPAVLRQFQIIAGLGFHFWWHDLIYTIGTKVPLAGWMIGLPSQAEINALYSKFGIRRWDQQPPLPIITLLLTLINSASVSFAAITLPRWGFVSTLLFGGLLVFALLRLSARIGAPILDHPAGRLLIRLWLPALVGVFLGFSVFAAFNIGMYIRHEFPLLLPFILVGKAAVLWALLDLALKGEWRLSGGAGLKVRVAAALGAIFLFVDASMVQLNNTQRGLYSNLGWRDFMLANRESKYLLIWDPWELRYWDKDVYWPAKYRDLPSWESGRVLVAHPSLGMSLMLSLLERRDIDPIPKERPSWAGETTVDARTLFDALSRTIKNEPAEQLERYLGIDSRLTVAMARQAHRGIGPAMSAYDESLLDDVDYVIFQPGENIAVLHGLNCHTCRQRDWLLDRLSALLRNLRRKPPSVTATAVEPSRGGPGTFFRFAATVDQGFDEVYVVPVGDPAPAASYVRQHCMKYRPTHCAAMRLEGWVAAPARQMNGPLNWNVVGKRGGETVTLAQFRARVARNAPRAVDALRGRFANDAITAREFAAQFPQIPVLASDARGIGYAVLDVRGLRKREPVKTRNRLPEEITRPRDR